MQNGTISEKRIDESYDRIMRLKNSFTFDKAYYQRELSEQKHQAMLNMRLAMEEFKKAQATKVNKQEVAEEGTVKKSTKKRVKKKE